MNRYGFVKLAAITPHLVLGDVKANTEEIIALAKQTDADVLVFPELSLTGATLGDLFSQVALLNSIAPALERIANASCHMQGKLLFVGAPLICIGKIFNCAVAIANGEILGVIPKTFLHPVRDAKFTRAQVSKELTIRVGKKSVPFGTDLLFCEEESELVVAAQIGEDLYAQVTPAALSCAGGANVVANLFADDASVGQDARRQLFVKAHSAQYDAAYVLANAGTQESTADYVFNGHSLIAVRGKNVKQHKYTFGALCDYVDVEKIEFVRRKKQNLSPLRDNYRRIAYKGTDTERLPEYVQAYPFIPEDKCERAARCEDIIALQAHALATRLQKIHAKSAVIGISGGLDSTLALIVTAEAFKIANLPCENILAVTMPGFGTSDQTFSSAKELIDRFGATMRIVPIKDACLQHFKDIGHDVDTHDVTYENTQARERTQILMDLANKIGGIVVGTGDLSELALGWCTYNGDHMSMYSVNGGVPKTLMQHIIAYYADTHESCAAVLHAVLDTPISPELLPPDKEGKIAQKTEERIGKYDLHDFIIFHALGGGCAPDKVFALACIAFPDVERETIKNTMRTFYRRFFTQQFKRNCLPDGPKIGSIGFSPRGDWSMPSEASAQLWLNQVDAIEI